MKHSFLIGILLSFFSQSLTAQIKYVDGKVSINNAPIKFVYGLNVKDWGGMYWTCKDGNFFQLDLTPDNPRIAGTSDEVVFYNSETNIFNSIQVADIYNYSDARAKDNVQTLTTGLNSLLRLRPVSYKWKHDNSEPISTFSYSDETNSVSKLAYGPKEDNNTKYGFLAQEVEEILPDAVYTDVEGHKLINYTTLIPMLVQAVQELQTTVEAQAIQLEYLCNGKYLYANKSESMDKIVSCTPNPANGRVIISAQIADNVSSAKITISSMKGLREKTIGIDASSPSICEDISTLDTGIHIVSLYVNDNLVDSHRLIVE